MVVLVLIGVLVLAYIVCQLATFLIAFASFLMIVAITILILGTIAKVILTENKDTML